MISSVLHDVISSVLHDDTADTHPLCYTMIQRMMLHDDPSVLHDDTADDIHCATR